MRCDLHVHTIHSGKCTVPGLSRVCLESCNEPREHDHIELRRRRTDTESLLTYALENQLFVTMNHAYSGLTGRRAAQDFAIFRKFHDVEGMPVTAGSDSHTLHGVGRTFTEITGVYSASQYVTALRRGQQVPHGESGNRWKIAQAISGIGWSMMRANRRTAVLSPLFALVPLFALGNYVHEQAFAWYWGHKSRTVAPEGKLLSLQAVEL